MNSLDHIFEELRHQAKAHLVSRQTVLHNKSQNFSTLLTALDHKQKKFWFGDVDVSTLDDLQRVAPHRGVDVLATQKQLPPFGVMDAGQLLFMSSGSTGTERPRWYFSWPVWLSHNIGAGRSLLAHGVDHDDSIMTMDVANNQLGYRQFEDAASMICGARVVKSGGTTWTDKLNLMLKHDITVLAGTTTKLTRLASMVDDGFSSNLRLVVQLGEPIAQPQIDFIKQKLKVSTLLDGYGSVEMGQVSYNCAKGHRHFHDDLVHLVNKDGASLFTNLKGLPVINYILGDQMEIEYNGPCACGSYLSTVTDFKNRPTPVNKKE